MVEDENMAKSIELLAFKIRLFISLKEKIDEKYIHIKIVKPK